MVPLSMILIDSILTGISRSRYFTTLNISETTEIAYSHSYNRTSIYAYALYRTVTLIPMTSMDP